MRPGPLEYLSAGKRTVLGDLRSDPYLKLILVVATMTSGLWIWYRVPNFITPDEYGRLLRPMKAAGYFAADPSLAAFARGATDGLAQGATFYLYGLTLIPVGVYVLLTGQFSEFASFGTISSRWTLWHAVPEWFWSSAILTARLANVIIAVASVYVMYRIAKSVYGESSGRLAALFFALSLGWIASAHEANEDTMMVFLLLVVLYLAIRYIESGDGAHFLFGSALGGLAIAFKLTGGVVVLILGASLLLRASRSKGVLSSDAYQPKLIGLGLLTGAVTIYVSMPNVLFSGPDELVKNILLQTAGKSEAPYINPPVGYFLLKSLLNGMGLPLFIGVLAGSFLSIRTLARGKQSKNRELFLLLAAALLPYLVVFGSWSVVFTHHVLPMIPLLILLAVHPLARLRREHRIGRVLVIGMLVTTTLYAGGGLVQFANPPRDQATDWIRTEVSGDESMAVYENSIADIAAVHGQPVIHYSFVEETGVDQGVVNESNSTEWMTSTPQRSPDYVQLTVQSLEYTDPLHRKSVRNPERARYIHQLVGGELGYNVAKEFGDRPTYLPYWQRLITDSVVPRIEKNEPYVVILERTDESVGNQTQN